MEKVRAVENRDTVNPAVRRIYTRNDYRNQFKAGESRFARLWRRKTADSFEKWKIPPAAILHTALKAAVSAFPLGSFVFDSEFLERVVQEAYPNWHAQAEDQPSWTAAERLTVSRKLISTLQNHMEDISRQNSHPRQEQARQSLGQIQERQKQIRLKLATELNPQRPSARVQLLTNMRHLSRIESAIKMRQANNPVSNNVVQFRQRTIPGAMVKKPPVPMTNNVKRMLQRKNAGMASPTLPGIVKSLRLDRKNRKEL